MGDSFAAPSHDAANHVHAVPQPTLALVNEDEDEPPSSGSHSSGEAQVDQNPSGDGSSSLPAVKQDGVYNAMAGKDSHVDIGVANIVNVQFVDRQETLVEDTSPAKSKERLGLGPDLEQGVRLTRRTRKPYTTFFGVRFKPGRRATKLRTLFTPTRPLGPSPTYKQSLRAALKYTPLNVLLLFIPVSWALHFTHQSPTLIFIFSALGLVPLAALLGFGTEQIALKTSASVGGLLNATLGNIIEMIIAGIALKEVGILFYMLLKPTGLT